MKKFTILLGLTVFTSALYGQAVCDGQQVVVTGDGQCNYNPYILVFEDNFNGNSLDLSKWELPYQGFGSTDFSTSKQWYANTGTSPNIPFTNNIEISNGILKLIAKKETVTGTYVTDWETNPPTTHTEPFNYTSAEIHTKSKFSHGKFEIRCKLPKGKGFFPAFWTFGGPGWNEIDVFEFWNEEDVFGNYDPSKLSKVHKMNAHYDYDGDGNSENCPTSYTGPDFSQAFHTFTVIWTPYKIEWYMDGDLKRISTLFYTMLGQIVDCNGVQAWTQYILDKAFPREPMNIIVNLAIQSGSNSPDANTPFPSSLEVDYIRYYKQMPCDGPLTVTDISTLSLSNEVYNIIIGTTINLSGNFTVQSGQQLEVVARDEITLGPGFTAEAGSDFIARIDPSICVGVNKMSGTSNDGTTGKDSVAYIEKSGIEDATITTEKDCKVRIFPNPNEGKFSVEFAPNSADMYELYLIDEQGRVLYSLKSIDNPNVEIDISKYSPGVYFLNILDTQNKNAYTHKIVKDK